MSSKLLLSAACGVMLFAAGCEEETATKSPTGGPPAGAATNSTAPKNDMSTDLGSPAAPEGSSTTKSGTDLAPPPAAGTDAPPADAPK